MQLSVNVVFVYFLSVLFPLSFVYCTSKVVQALPGTGVTVPAANNASVCQPAQVSCHPSLLGGWGRRITSSGTTQWDLTPKHWRRAGSFTQHVEALEPIPSSSLVVGIGLWPLHFSTHLRIFLLGKTPKTGLFPPFLTLEQSNVFYLLHSVISRSLIRIWNTTL